MHVQVHYQGMENSPWVDQFITRKISRLDRYLGNGSSVQVHLRHDKKGYSTSLAIHHPWHDYAFSSNGDNLYESFTAALDKALRSLGDQKKKIKDRINKKFFSINKKDFEV